jgi:hypothetical protein
LPRHIWAHNPALCGYSSDADSAADVINMNRVRIISIAGIFGSSMIAGQRSRKYNSAPLILLTIAVMRTRGRSDKRSNEIKPYRSSGKRTLGGHIGIRFRDRVDRVHAYFRTDIQYGISIRHRSFAAGHPLLKRLFVEAPVHPSTA